MPGPVKLGDIAARLGVRIIGGADTLIEQVASLEHAGPRHLAFYSGPRYRAQLAATRAGAVILAPQAEAATPLPRLVADNPHACFAKAAQHGTQPRSGSRATADALFGGVCDPPVGIVVE